MDAFSLVLMIAVIFALAALGMLFCVRMMKKAGIPTGGLGYYKKLLYDNCTLAHDSRTASHHRTCWRSKKGGKLSLEVAQTRGTLLLEFYTEDGQILQRWQTGDPAAFTVALPPRVRVYRRMEMSHFSGSITFR